ncbi:hypothetical protein QFC21_006438 [Naganishia friedmannii]|uniref:Uncharacterized protein n=1 Tax=Naganishia friedmannii TaxID=89922 RepID=A0ACC2V2U7_9TREE|nr:hypothetical protein QFC21_006438 [Naganishia friedmannii]
MKILIGTHAFHLHLLDFDPATASLTQISKIELKEQPSFALQHPVHQDLFYVNAWVDSIIYVIRIDKESGKLEILCQAESGGGGPTYFILTPEGESLLIANYRSGDVTRLGVDRTTGLLESKNAAETDILKLPYTLPQGDRPHRLVDRQSFSHPHQVIALPKRKVSDIQTYLVPDLGGDAVFVVSYTKEEHWKIWNKWSSRVGWGPRHGVVNSVGDSHYLYLVNELVNIVTIHPLTFDSNGIPSITSPVQACSTVPSHLAKAYVPVGPYESIACTILLHTTPEGSQQLIVTNRNANENIRPEGDSVIVLPINANGKEFDVEGAQHLIGAGQHLRAAAVTSGVGEDKAHYLLIGARNGQGLTVYRQGKGSMGEWDEVLRNARLDGLDLPISADWL